MNHSKDTESKKDGQNTRVFDADMVRRNLLSTLINPFC